MKTLNAWLIANFNTITNILFIVILIVAALDSSNDEIVNEVKISAFCYSFLPVFAVSFMSIVTKGEKLIVGTIGAILAATIEFFLIFHCFENSYPKTLLVVSFVLGAVLSSFIAIFTSRNFKEVISRRMLWRKSNVEILDMKISYVLNRYFNATVRFASILFIVLFLPWATHHTDQIEKADSLMKNENTELSQSR